MCVHWWMIAAPNDEPGPESAGVCKRCGESRTFVNGAKAWSLRDKAIVQSGFPKRGPRDPFALSDER